MRARKNEVTQMMRKRLALSGLLFLALPLGSAVPSRMNVQVQNGQVRATASFLGQVLVAVPYGTTVEILQQKGDWMQVKSPQGQVGWMHQSALTTKKITMGAGTTVAKTGASSDELALAGKGFNSDVEKEYKARNANLNFAAVDRMEQIKVSAEEMKTFLATGTVKPAEGGEK
jgi:hypothetical protein